MTALAAKREFDSPGGSEGPWPSISMVIYVKADPTAGQRSGDWKVTTDGGRTISRHRKKSAAKRRARQEARERGESVRIQNASTGHWNQGPSY